MIYINEKKPFIIFHCTPQKTNKLKFGAEITTNQGVRCLDVCLYLESVKTNQQLSSVYCEFVSGDCGVDLWTNISYITVFRTLLTEIKGNWSNFISLEIH